MTGFHAATPWAMEVHELSEGFSAIIYNANGICVLDHLSEPIARRIVAAVNATAEIDVEHLETGVIAEAARYLEIAIGVIERSSVFWMGIDEAKDILAKIGGVK